MLVDDDSVKSNKAVGIIKSDWQGGVSSTADRVVREGLSIEDLK